MKRGKIILIEGVSCAGKTTVCRRLSEEKEYHIIPEAIRYIERITGKQHEEALPTPTNEDEEKRNQKILFNVELQKIREANELANSGKDVVIDKSLIAVMATAFAFEKMNGYKTSFAMSIDLFKKFLGILKKEKMIFCDMFLYLDADKDVLESRNYRREHVLDNFWINEELLKYQHIFLEKFFERSDFNKRKINTTNLNKEETYQMACLNIENRVNFEEFER